MHVFVKPSTTFDIAVLCFFSSPTVIRLGRRVCCHCFSLRLFSCLLFLLLLSALPLLFLKCFRSIKGNLCIVFSFELLYVEGGGSRCPSCRVNVRFYPLKLFSLKTSCELTLERFILIPLCPQRGF